MEDNNNGGEEEMSKGGNYGRPETHAIASYGADKNPGFMAKGLIFDITSMKEKYIAPHLKIHQNIRDEVQILTKAKKLTPYAHKLFSDVIVKVKGIQSDIESINKDFPEISINSPQHYKDQYIKRLVSLKEKIREVLNEITTADYSKIPDRLHRQTMAQLATQLNNLLMKITMEIDRISPNHPEGFKAEMQKALQK